MEQRILFGILWAHLFFFCLAAAGTAFAAPGLINYQGRITGSGGMALDGTYEMRFYLYDNETGGNQLFSAPNGEQQSVLVSDGIYSVQIGASAPLDPAIFAVDNLWLQVGIYNEAASAWEILSPRQRLSSVPYALQAETAKEAVTVGGMHAADFAAADHIHSGSDIVSGTINKARIDPDIARDTEITWSNLSGIPSELDDGDDVGILAETDPTVAPSVKDGVSWEEIANRPPGLDDGDDTGIGAESDPQVGSNSNNRVPRWNGSALVSGSIFDTGTKIGIGTSSPQHTLHVAGDGSGGYTANISADYDSPGVSAMGLYIDSNAYYTGSGWGYGANFRATGGGSGGFAYASQHFALAYGSSNAYGVYSNAVGGMTTGHEYAFYGIGKSYFSDNVGIGIESPLRQLHVVDDQDHNYIARFENKSTGTGGDGIEIKLGPPANPGPSNYFLKFMDGDGTYLGGVSGNSSGGVKFVSASDARLKIRIEDFDSGLGTVSLMKVRKYEFIEAPGIERIGFIAQELQSVFPEAVSGRPDGDVKTDPMGVDYGRITPVLVSAVQQLKKENEALKTEINKIKALINQAVQ